MVMIDPNNPKPKHIPILMAMLDQASPERFGWSNMCYYTVYDKENRKKEVALTDTLIKRPSKNGGFRYDTLEQSILGQGTYGSVSAVNSTLKIQQNELIIKNKPYGKRRIVKKTPYQPIDSKNFSAKDTYQKAIQEYDLALMTPHLHPKFPVVYKEWIFGVQRRMEGRDLIDIINDDITGKCMLILEERFLLTLNLIESLEEQIFAAGLIHRDLKPENIIVDIDLSVSIIDLGLGQLSNQSSKGERVGSLPFVSPEVIRGKGATQSSDMYSMGRIIALLWRIDTSKYNIKNARQTLNIAKANDYSSLFRGLEGLNDESASIISQTLKSMTDFHSRNRATPKEALGQIYSACKLQYGSSSAQEKRHFSEPEAVKQKSQRINIADKGKEKAPKKSRLRSLTAKFGLFKQKSGDEEPSTSHNKKKLRTNKERPRNDLH